MLNFNELKELRNEQEFYKYFNKKGIALKNEIINKIKTHFNINNDIENKSNLSKQQLDDIAGGVNIIKTHHFFRKSEYVIDNDTLNEPGLNFITEGCKGCRKTVYLIDLNNYLNGKCRSEELNFLGDHLGVNGFKLADLVGKGYKAEEIGGGGSVTLTKGKKDTPDYEKLALTLDDKIIISSEKGATIPLEFFTSYGDPMLDSMGRKIQMYFSQRNSSERTAIVSGSDSSKSSLVVPAIKDDLGRYHIICYEGNQVKLHYVYLGYAGGYRRDKTFSASEIVELNDGQFTTNNGRDAIYHEITTDGGVLEKHISLINGVDLKMDHPFGLHSEFEIYHDTKDTNSQYIVMFDQNPGKKQSELTQEVYRATKVTDDFVEYIKPVDSNPEEQHLISLTTGKDFINLINLNNGFRFCEEIPNHQSGCEEKKNCVIDINSGAMVSISFCLINKGSEIYIANFRDTYFVAKGKNLENLESFTKIKEISAELYLVYKGEDRNAIYTLTNDGIATPVERDLAGNVYFSDCSHVMLRDGKILNVDLILNDGKRICSCANVDLNPSEHINHSQQTDVLDPKSEQSTDLRKRRNLTNLGVEVSKKRYYFIDEKGNVYDAVSTEGSVYSYKKGSETHYIFCDRKNLTNFSDITVAADSDKLPAALDNWGNPMIYGYLDGNKDKLCLINTATNEWFKATRDSNGNVYYEGQRTSIEGKDVIIKNAIIEEIYDNNGGMLFHYENDATNLRYMDEGDNISLVDVVIPDKSSPDKTLLLVHSPIIPHQSKSDVELQDLSKEAPKTITHVITPDKKIVETTEDSKGNRYFDKYIFLTDGKRAIIEKRYENGYLLCHDCDEPTNLFLLTKDREICTVEKGPIDLLLVHSPIIHQPSKSDTDQNSIELQDLSKEAPKTITHVITRDHKIYEATIDQAGNIHYSNFMVLKNGSVASAQQLELKNGGKIYYEITGDAAYFVDKEGYVYTASKAQINVAESETEKIGTPKAFWTYIDPSDNEMHFILIDINGPNSGVDFVIKSTESKNPNVLLTFKDGSELHQNPGSEILGTFPSYSIVRVDKKRKTKEEVKKLTKESVKIEQLDMGTKYTVTLDDKGTTEEHIVLKNGTDLIIPIIEHPLASNGVRNPFAFKYTIMKKGKPKCYAIELNEDGTVKKTWSSLLEI